MSERVYADLAGRDISAADLVRELRRKWGPDHGVGEVHRFVEEVAACLLRDDVQLGYAHNGRFAPWRLDPWDAHFKLQQELLAMDTFLDDTARFVFHRCQKV